MPIRHNYYNATKAELLMLSDSDNESVATVSGTGVVTGVAKGTAVITATSGFEGDNVTVTITA